MGLAIKAIMLLWLGTGIGLLAWRWLVGKKADQLVPRSIQIAVFAIPASVYLIPNVNLWFVFVSLLVPLCVMGKRTSPLQAYICLLALVPAISYSVRIGSAYLLDLDGYELLGIGFCVVAFIVPRPPGHSRGGIVDILFSLLMLVLFAFQISEGNFGLRKITETLTTLVIPYIALRRTLTSPQAIQIVANGVVFSAIILAGIGFVEWLWKWPLYHSAYSHFGIETPGTSAWAKLRGNNLRIPTSFVESTSFGVFLSLAMVAAASQRQLLQTRNKQFIALGLIAFVTMVTYSRGAVVAIFVGLVAMLFVRGLLAKSLATAAVFGVFGALTLAMANWNAGIESIVRPEVGGNKEYRLEFWRLGSEMVRENPWLGSTLKAMNDRMPELRGEGFVDPVNTYLYFSIRAGLGGGLVLLLTLIIPLLMLWLVRRKLPTYGQQANLGMLFGWFTMMTFHFGATSFHERNPLWLFLCLAMAAAVFGSVGRQRPVTQSVTKEP
jgi:O-antigen ligase